MDALAGVGDLTGKGWNPGDHGFTHGCYWIVRNSGLRSSYRDRERFRYALRNEHGYGATAADAIVDAVDAMRPYKPWRQRYSGEDFDRAQSRASELTDADRAAGRNAPECGYSQANFDRAQREVKDAQV